MSGLALGSLLITLGIPVAIIFLLIWVYTIKRNSDIQVEQNKKIIQLLEEQSLKNNK